MFDRLQQLESRYEDLGAQLALPENTKDHEKYQKLAKQHRDLEAVVNKFRDYKHVKAGIADAEGMLLEDDAEIRAMAADER